MAMIGRRAFLRRSGGTLALGAAGAALGMSWTRPALAECTGATITDGVLSRFRSRIQGSVILPVDTQYATARVGFNRRFDPYPVMVVRSVGTADVARTIEFARTNGIKLAIRSGGHSYIGASGGSGIVLDLSAMNGIAPLGDGHFHIGAGAQLQQVYGALRCQENMTIPCGSCETVGFGGIAQGGGFGYLQQEHGITLDRVRSARVVLADGTTVDASPDGDSDLFWAIRGAGGGSLGVVTDFTVEAVPYKTIHVIGWYWPLTRASEALALFASLQESGAVPRSATVALVFNNSAAALTTPQCVCVLFSTGTVEEAEATKQLYVGAGGIRATPGLGFAYDADSPACDPHAVAQRDYYRAKSAIVYGQPAADTGDYLRYWIERRVADPMFSAADSATVNFLTFGGAVSDVGPSDTAFPHRNALLEVQFLGYLQNPTTQSIRGNQAWIQGVYADVFPRLSMQGEGCYVNYCDDDLTEEQWTSRYWGANYPRLQNTKRRVDPSDFFRGKQTIRL